MKVFDGVRKQVRGSSPQTQTNEPLNDSHLADPMVFSPSPQVKSKAGISEVSDALNNIGVQLQLLTTKNDTISSGLETKVDRGTLERLLAGQEKEEEAAAKEIEVGKPFFAVYRCKKPFKPQGLGSLYDENRSVLAFEEMSQTMYEGSLPDLPGGKKAPPIKFIPFPRTRAPCSHIGSSNAPTIHNVDSDSWNASNISACI